MPKRLRLDVELVRRGEARSREHARELIESGRVNVAGMRASKPATAVSTDVAIHVRSDDAAPDYVSRGGHKLAGALADFTAQGFRVQGRRCLDAGASTGGFTDVLLRAGAAEVLAVDVGYGQLAWSLQSDPRVRVFDRTNIKDLSPEIVAPPVEVVTGDLSFISLRLVLPALLSVTSPEGDLALMVKPQFEVGKDRVGKGGVVRDPDLRVEAVAQVAQTAQQLGWPARAVTTSKLPGPAGNLEYFLWLQAGSEPIDHDAIRAEVRRTQDLSPASEKVRP